MDNLQYLQAFLDESQENIQVLNTVCLKMEQETPVDDDFATLFRAAHTLKGMSATMGYNGMAKLTHRLEDALGYLREHPDQLVEDFVDTLFASIDALEQALEQIRDVGSEGETDHADLVARLEQVLKGGVAAGTAKEIAVTTVAPPAGKLAIDGDALNMARQAQKQGRLVGMLIAELDPACVMKGPRSIMVSRAIEELGDCLYCNPAPQIMESGSFDETTLSFLVALESGEDELVHRIQNISEVTKVQFESFNEESLVGGTQQPVETATESKSAAKAGATKPAAKTEKTDKIDRTIRVPVERLDGLMNLLSELVIDKTRLASIATQLGRQELKELTDRISRVSNDLQTSVMSLRMVPVEQLFQRFPRMVRDLSKSLDKDIQLEMTGLETEFDRTVIDEMGEALVHLIRNSADHGLEATQDRIAKGKPAAGTISLRAYASGQSVFIEVSDDGQGIHVEKVRQRAIERGIVTESAARAMSDKQVHTLLFESGFSTAETISDISGRGVGLDAVKRKVESLGGSIAIESVSGQGSTFRVQLPLTLSILQALLVNVQSDVYAIPLGNVEEVIYATEQHLKQIHGNTVLSYRDYLVPIIDGGEMLYHRSSTTAYPWKLVIVKEGSKRIAIAVDKLLGQQEIVHKSLGEYLKTVRLFAGATILGDGNIALIVDTHAWVSDFA